MVTFRFRPVRSLGPLALLLMGCLRQDGVVDPGDPEIRPVLATLVGQMRPQPDTSIFDSRLFQDFPNPQIALVWEFIGTKVNGSSLGDARVEVSSPYRFSLPLTGLPPEEVARSQEPVFGHLWLYSDRNGNGRLDRLEHPEVTRLMAQVDSLRDIWVEDEKAFHATADTLPEAVAVTDTFLVDRIGTLFRVSGGQPDTLYRSSGPGDTSAWIEIIFRRSLVLKNNNYWENFFALRKQAHTLFWYAVPDPVHPKRVIVQDWQVMVPKRGMEKEFRARLRDVTLSYLRRFAALRAMERASERAGWADYPYNGHKEPGADWVAGRSTWYHILYFPDSASMQVPLAAEKGGTFQVDGLTRLRRGYNVLHCDDQYRCRVLSPGDSIYIDLGMKESYFNPPSSPLKVPIREFAPLPIEPTRPEELSGGWRYRIFGPLTTFALEGGLWADIPMSGLFRLEAVDSLRWFVPGRDVQLEFVPDPGGESYYKLLVYTGGQRYAAQREDSLSRAAVARGAARERLALDRSAWPDSLAETAPRRFVHGPDTLALGVSAAGDSLTLSLPGLPDQICLAAPGGAGHCPHTGDALRLRRDGAGAPVGLELVRDGTALRLPEVGYRPRPAADLFPGIAPADSLVASETGTGPDSYRGFAGRRRYACPGDSAYLRAGDGWVEGFARGITGDSISLFGNGDALVLRLEGLAGRSARLELSLCREQGGPALGRMLAGLEGRAGEGGAWTPLADDAWAVLGNRGDTLSLGPFPVPEEGYEVRFLRRTTPDAPFHFAFEGYRVFAGPAP